MVVSELVFEGIVLFNEEVILLGFELDLVTEEVDLILGLFEFKIEILFAGPDGFKILLFLFIKGQKFLMFKFLSFVQKFELL